VAGTEQPPTDDARSAFLADAARAAASSLGDDAVLAGIVSGLHELHPGWDWTGIYLLRSGVLELGPFAGAPTEHTRIEIGVGVCGTAVATGANQRIDDVDELDNYLACSVGTRSELVVLIRHDGEIVGQLDIDSDETGTFTDADERFLERLAEVVSGRCAAAASD
jgi:L-methionine (R)-S-oxide reductase